MCPLSATCLQILILGLIDRDHRVDQQLAEALNFCLMSWICLADTLVKHSSCFTLLFLRWSFVRLGPSCISRRLRGLIDFNVLGVTVHAQALPVDILGSPMNTVFIHTVCETGIAAQTSNGLKLALYVGRMALSNIQLYYRSAVYVGTGTTPALS
jgi:hypothetical protein